MEENIVFFDGVCNLCSGVVQWLIKQDKKNVLFYAPLQGETAKALMLGNKLNKIDSIIFSRNGKIYTKSTAVLQIAKVLGFPFYFALVFTIVPSFVRDAIYDWIARNRYQWFGQKNECWLPNTALLAKFKK